jgi:F420-dependent oxidoreductase-like protein
MDVGIVIPQGWTGEYAGWRADDAWRRSVAIAEQAERLGFESIWVFDHFHTTPRPTDNIVFEAFTALTALAVATRRPRVGQLVLCAGYRNPALVAKMAGTLDVISGGRFDLGLGAGWKADEWRAFGYGFPPIKDRLAALEDSLEIVKRMLTPGHATYDGRWGSVHHAINEPKGIQQPRIPIVVGGNGPNVTWRLAARHADELNLDGLGVEETRDAMPVIRDRCREIGRDPDSLAVSVHIDVDVLEDDSRRRRALLRGYADLGVRRVMALLTSAVSGDGALDSLAEDVTRAGLSLASPRASA